jgi:hypothetical protein
MASPDQNGGALVGVRLAEVPLKTRAFYGKVLMDRAAKELEPIKAVMFAAQVERAVEEPSDRVYWVSRKEYERVMKK